jgi:hypothetical protein
MHSALKKIIYGPQMGKNIYGPPVAKNIYGPPMAKNIYGPQMAKNVYGLPMAKNTFSSHYSQYLCSIQDEKGWQTKFLENGDNNNKSNP